MGDSNQDATAKNINSVTVYAGSGDNIPDIYRDCAFELGKLIADEGWVQVNGGGKTGMMGAVTKGASSVGGIVDSVILDKFLGENEHEFYRNQYVYDTMSKRKKGLFDRCDAIITLPGGLGSLDELAESLCMRQLGFHEKPMVVINTDGFYNGLRSFIDNAVTLNFISAKMTQGGVYFAEDPKQAIQYLKMYRPVNIDTGCVNSGEMNSKT